MLIDDRQIVVGIDLSTEPKKTGVVVLESIDNRFVASTPLSKADDAALTKLSTKASIVGIDAPLGWPTAFVEAVVRHQAHHGWQEPFDSSLRWRATDRFIHRELRQIPLSVSTDRLGATALRCARLQSMWETAWGSRIDRSGSGKVVEVYPAATLTACAIPRLGYKQSEAARELLIAELRDLTKSWLDISAVIEPCVASDDVCDGLVAAVTAVLAASGATIVPTGDDVELSRTEGWIHAPPVGFDLSTFCPDRPFSQVAGD